MKLVKMKMKTIVKGAKLVMMNRMRKKKNNKLMKKAQLSTMPRRRRNVRLRKPTAASRMSLRGRNVTNKRPKGARRNSMSQSRKN